MGAKAILDQANELGITLRAVDDHIRYRPKASAPPEFVEALRQHKADVLGYLRREAIPKGFEPWVLWEWRRVSIPEWRRILRVSIVLSDGMREQYARWMLSEVLLDPEYENHCP